MEFIVHGKKQLNKTCAYAKISSVYIPTKQHALTLGYCPKTSEPNYYKPPIADMAMQYISLISTHKISDASPKHYRVEEELPTRHKKLPFSQQNKTSTFSRIVSWNTSPKQHPKSMGNSYQCLAPLPISTSKREQSQFPCLFFSKSQ